MLEWLEQHQMNAGEFPNRRETISCGVNGKHLFASLANTEHLPRDHCRQSQVHGGDLVTSLLHLINNALSSDFLAEHGGRGRHGDDRLRCGEMIRGGQQKAAA